jgi:hypothetical protein
VLHVCLRCRCSNVSSHRTKSTCIASSILNRSNHHGIIMVGNGDSEIVALFPNTKYQHNHTTTCKCWRHRCKAKTRGSTRDGRTITSSITISKYVDISILFFVISWIYYYGIEFRSMVVVRIALCHSKNAFAVMETVPRDAVVLLFTRCR